MPDTAPSVPAVALRPPAQVMRLARMGAFHQTRLSFMRALLRRLKAERWRFDRPRWDIDARGFGTAVYRATGPRNTYSLMCFSHDLDPSLRTDRVIAEAWDATFALFDGEPERDDIERLRANVPRQEAGRCRSSELVLSRANKSVRLFDHVADCLARGEQPERERVEAVGYLMRTTAVYGNGKFGLADRDLIAERPEMAAPFHAEMLAVWLIRAFTVDLVEHIAAQRAPETAVPLEPGLRRRFGVGNSTGLGMAPFLVNHPCLLHSWILARETALARVRALPRATPESLAAFRQALAGAGRGVAEWRTEDARQQRRIAELRADLDRLQAVAEALLAGPMPWDALYRWAEANLSLEAQELTVTLVIEPHGDLVDGLTAQMATDETARFRIDGRARVGELRARIEREFDWCLTMDFSAREAQARFWYVSEEKLEPRLGERFGEPGMELEQPLATARDIHNLHRDLARMDAGAGIAAFLLDHPEHRHIVRRLQALADQPYAEIRDNLIGADLLPIDLLRCKLSFFGAGKFDPRSDRWVRITMYQDAPFPHELGRLPADAWAYPAD